MEMIDRYQILSPIAKGGMGEVVLAFDPLCNRKIALKKIRSDLQNNRALKERFLKEAKLTAELTHPGVISIYTIQEKHEPLYYTMPYVEGESLKILLHKASEQSLQQIDHRFLIPSLLPQFVRICETIAYAHMKNIYHRDLKPENILIGKYGEVIVLDWGVALKKEEKEIAISIENPSHLTLPGKVVGTLNALAPERARGEPATVATEIYALGIILYQILTLKLPFKRKTLKLFQKHSDQEKLIPPEKRAPYRDVPLKLSQIAMKCLEKNPLDRYQSVTLLLEDLTQFSEGRSDWFFEESLSIKRAENWQFQEHLMISRNLALTPEPSFNAWANVMLSAKTYPESMQIKTKCKIGKEGAGIGIILGIPEKDQRKTALDGFCLWLSSEKKRPSVLLRNSFEVLTLPTILLEKEVWHEILIQKIEEKLHLQIDSHKEFIYQSYLPLLGNHFGLLSFDYDYELQDLEIFVSSQPLKSSCLTKANTLLATRNYDQALVEYRRIGASFPGHAEGREALFRAGVVLIEEGRHAKNPQKQKFFELALEEFTKLHLTPGAPYEYLGKALVLEALEDFSEEVKYLELGLRRFTAHPLKHILVEQILYRMHESAKLKRKAAYQLVSVVLRLLPEKTLEEDTSFVLKELVGSWEHLPFLENSINSSNFSLEKNEWTILEKKLLLHLGFWLNNSSLLEELFFLSPLDTELAGDIVFSLFELEQFSLAEELLKKMPIGPQVTFLTPLALPLAKAWDHLSHLFYTEAGIQEIRTVLFLCQKAIEENACSYVERFSSLITSLPLAKEHRILIDSMRIWAFLRQGDWKNAEQIFDTYPKELFNQETTLLHPLYGCFLAQTESEEIALIHLAGITETPFPRSFALLGHELTYLISENSNWINQSFLWEKKQLYRQLELFYFCNEDNKKSAFFAHLTKDLYKS